MSNLPHDLMDESTIESIADDDGVENIETHRPLNRPLLALILVLTMVVACALSALISWIVVDLKSARMSPFDNRLTLLENAMAVSGGSIDTQKSAINDLRNSLNKLELSVENLKSNDTSKITDQLSSDFNELKLSVISLKKTMDLKASAPKTVAPYKPQIKQKTQITHTSTRVYSIRTQGDKQWTTLIEAGRISPALAVGDSWHNVKIKQIDDAKIIVEINRKEISLFI